MTDYERKLLAQAQDGSPNAFSELIWPLQTNLLNRARRLCLHYCIYQIDPADLLMEALQIAWLKIGEFDLETTGIEPWIGGILTRTAKNRGKQARKERDRFLSMETAEREGTVSVFNELSLEAAGPPEENLVLAQIVREEVARLPKRQRQILVNHIFWERSLSEIANRLGLSPASIRSQYHTARETLRKHIHNKALMLRDEI